MNKKTNTITIIMTLAILCVQFTAFSVQAAGPDLSLTMLNQDPDPAGPGDYVELRWKVINSGNDEIEDLKFKLKEKYPLMFDGSDIPEKEVGTMIGLTDQEEEYYTLHYKVRIAEDAIEDTYEMILSYEYKYKGQKYTQTKKFDLRVDDDQEPRLFIGNINTEPIKLMPDTEENKLNVDIINTGSGDAENMDVTLILPEGFEATYSYSDKTNIGNVAGGESKTSSFYIDLDEELQPGSYKTELILRYNEENENEIIEKKLGFNIDVKNKPTFEIVNLEYDKETITAGEQVKAKVTIKNIGTKKAESVSIRAFKESSQPLEFNEKSDYIGTLEPGEEGEGLFILSLDNDAEQKKYLIDYEIRSIDQDEVFIQEETMQLTVNRTEEKGSIIPIIIGIIFALGIIAGAYFLGKNDGFKKHKK